MAGQEHEQTHKVLIVDNHSIFSAGVQKLFAERSELQVVLTTAANAKRLRAEIEKFQPDLVVFDQSDHHVLCALLEAQLQGLAVTLVEMNPELPVALVYRRQPMPMATFEDLMALAQSSRTHSEG